MKANEIKITFTGDAFIDNNVISSFNNKDYSFKDCYKNISKYFSKSNYVICNLETPISKDKNDYEKKAYTFCSPIEFAKALKNCGIKCFTTANNHCIDNGVLGMKKTVSCLNELNVDHTGVHSKYIIKEINGVKIGIYSCTYGTNAFNNNIYLTKEEEKFVNLIRNQELSNTIIRKLYKNNDIITRILRKSMSIFHLFQMNKFPHERIENSIEKTRKTKKDIMELRSKCDLLFVCLHDGLQNNQTPSKNIKKSIDYISKLGVDMIICNHEHLIQKIEYVNNVPVCYCLGNFSSPTAVFSKPFDDRFLYSLLINVYIDCNSKKISKKSFVILKQTKSFLDGKFSNNVNLLEDIISSKKNNSVKPEEKYYEEILNVIDIEFVKNGKECFF